eukprot:scaffold337229_cov18-Prasinocladus_malaysianus.AAC.1
MEIRQLQSHVKFEEFDFSFYNRTKFAGLENSMANCYCNPLLQAQRPFLTLMHCLSLCIPFARRSPMQSIEWIYSLTSS